MLALTSFLERGGPGGVFFLGRRGGGVFHHVLQGATSPETKADEKLSGILNVQHGKGGLP